MPARELRDLRAHARGASPKNSKICKMQRKKEKKKKRKKKEDKQVGGRVGPDRTETPDKFRF